MYHTLCTSCTDGMLIDFLKHMRDESRNAVSFKSVEQTGFVFFNSRTPDKRPPMAELKRSVKEALQDEIEGFVDFEQGKIIHVFRMQILDYYQQRLELIGLKKVRNRRIEEFVSNDGSFRIGEPTPQYMNEYMSSISETAHKIKSLVELVTGYNEWRKQRFWGPIEIDYLVEKFHFSGHWTPKVSNFIFLLAVEKELKRRLRDIETTEVPSACIQGMWNHGLTLDIKSECATMDSIIPFPNVFEDLREELRGLRPEHPTGIINKPGTLKNPIVLGEDDEDEINMEVESNNGLQLDLVRKTNPGIENHRQNMMMSNAGNAQYRLFNSEIFNMRGYHVIPMDTSDQHENTSDYAPDKWIEQQLSSRCQCQQCKPSFLSVPKEMYADKKIVLQNIHKSARNELSAVPQFEVFVKMLEYQSQMTRPYEHLNLKELSISMMSAFQWTQRSLETEIDERHFVRNKEVVCFFHSASMWIPCLEFQQALFSERTGGLNDAIPTKTALLALRASVSPATNIF